MNSHKTAMARNTLPMPVRWLLSQELIRGRVLDYGCGKCKPINDSVMGSNPLIKSITSYDPHYEPNALQECGWMMFDVVLCTYVLCTLPQEDELKVLRAMQSFISRCGVAYITVRNDEPKSGYGMSSKGTFQRRVIMPYLYQVRETTQYRIYLLTRGTKLVL